MEAICGQLRSSLRLARKDDDDDDDNSIVIVADGDDCHTSKTIVVNLYAEFMSQIFKYCGASRAFSATEMNFLSYNTKRFGDRMTCVFICICAERLDLDDIGSQSRSVGPKKSHLFPFPPCCCWVWERLELP